MDWFVTSIFDDVSCDQPFGECTGNRLYVGNGDGTFLDGTAAAGVVDGGWGWGAVAVDFDHDRDLDLIEVNGVGLTGPYWDDVPRVFRNRGDLTFAEAACAHGLAHPGVSKGIVPIDIEGDGDLDLFVGRSFEDPLLFRNDGASERPWLQVRLSQPGPNPDGVGARVSVEGAGAPMHRQIHLNPGYGSVGAPEAHFGLGDHEGPVDVVVRWPDGSLQRVTAVASKQRLTIVRE